MMRLPTAGPKALNESGHHERLRADQRRIPKNAAAAAPEAELRVLV